MQVETGRKAIVPYSVVRSISLNRSVGWSGLDSRVKSCPRSRAFCSGFSVPARPERSSTLQLGHSSLKRYARSIPESAGITTSETEIWCSPLVPHSERLVDS